jgi:phosphoribosyl-AMP cyclohydrolase / phosphoribosyl-ATP pyrophosphohydrolase
MIITNAAQLGELAFGSADGLLPVVAQHAHTGEVLMLAHANREAVERTLAEGVMWYWSRSRRELWRKGATSGNVQALVALHADCDRDALVAHVLPAGPSCHTGEWSCFDAAPTLAHLAHTIAQRAAESDSGVGAGSYTRRLLEDDNLRLKKLGEEAVELALACERGDAARAAEEAADLIYHALVACRAAGAGAADVLAALDSRRGSRGRGGGPDPAGTPAVSGADVVREGGGTASAG